MHQLMQRLGIPHFEKKSKKITIVTPQATKLLAISTGGCATAMLTLGGGVGLHSCEKRRARDRGTGRMGRPGWAK
jgi:hypothetical protein